MTDETAVHGVLTGITFWGEDLATWGLLVTFIMALAAIATAMSAKSQNKVALQGLDLSKAGLHFAAGQHIAQVLVILHARWHSLEFRDSRDKVYKLLEEAQQDIIKRNPDMEPVVITQQASQYCPEKLTTLYQSNIDEYRLMMRVVGFFELAGYLVDAKDSRRN